ncbi:hypothetical protein B0537_15235 [Desulforamulus ferrireducens]|uniref:Uncharacterized protein n=1 Tax=Desulforamulus ferrireducens TaxID=1833852 RepID=A0A1S6IZV6_9FIRM|nr:hypothetical protein B0537_15235 [Desulforamulus ferrireducens]
MRHSLICSSAIGLKAFGLWQLAFGHQPSAISRRLFGLNPVLVDIPLEMGLYLSPLAEGSGVVARSAWGSIAGIYTQLPPAAAPPPPSKREVQKGLCKAIKPRAESRRLMADGQYTSSPNCTTDPLKSLVILTNIVQMFYGPLFFPGLSSIVVLEFSLEHQPTLNQ